MPWLRIEAGRPLFKVQPTEQQRDFRLGPLSLSLRIDRIDETAAGLVILDYKTGAAEPGQWRTGRPDEPQLPLYAVLAQEAGEQVGGVAFATLRPGKGLALAGFSDDSSLNIKLAEMEAPSLDEQIALWRERLTTLAEAYAAGDTRVQPKAYPTTCRYCAQRILCRLDPSTLEQLDDDDLTGEEDEPSFNGAFAID